MPDEEAGSSEETKRDRFVRLAESRTNNAIRSIRTISKLGNKSYYEFDDGDVRKIVGALTREIEALKTRMSDQGGREPREFKL